MSKTPVAKKPVSPSSSRHGIPRTHAIAKKMGAVPAKITYDDLPAELKTHFMKLSDSGARAGSLCGMGTSTTPGMVLVCYKNEYGQCHWVEFPKGETPPTHDEPDFSGSKTARPVGTKRRASRWSAPRSRSPFRSLRASPISTISIRCGSRRTFGS
jgi:hypothetical protein